MKAWYESKTLWVNVITMLVLILELFTAQNGQALLPPQFIPWIAVAVAVLNIILRVWFTSRPVTEYAAKK